MLDKLLGALLGRPAEEIADYLKEKQRIKGEIKLEKLKTQAAWEKAKQDRAAKAAENDHDFRMLSVQNSGWKDEFVLLVISTPMIMSFIPGLARYVGIGFDNLSQMPNWYKGMVVAIFLAIYGLKKADITWPWSKK